jgi:hypothetical protein
MDGALGVLCARQSLGMPFSLAWDAQAGRVGGSGMQINLTPDVIEEVQRRGGVMAIDFIPPIG